MEDRQLPKFNLKGFSEAMLARVAPWAASRGINVVRVMYDFIDYKQQVPTCGAILLTPQMDKCLMVQGYKTGTWGFPRGKIGKGEDPAACAIREVWEETGYDCSALLNPQAHLQWNNPDSQARLYLVTGVPEETEFSPQTRREIRSIRWFPLDQITRNGEQRYYNVHFFIRRLKSWIKRQRKLQADEGDGDAEEADVIQSYLATAPPIGHEDFISAPYTAAPEKISPSTTTTSTAAMKLPQIAPDASLLDILKSNSTVRRRPHTPPSSDTLRRPSLNPPTGPEHFTIQSHLTRAFQKPKK